MSIPDKVMKLKDGKILYDDLRERVEDVKSDVENKYTKPANGIPAADLAETYLTSETDPTVPAWAKASTKPTYTAVEVGATTSTEVASMIATAIGNVHSFDILVVEQLPEQDIQTHTIYFVPKTGDASDSYDEYIYVNNAWEKIGNTQVDLSNYALKTDTVLNTTLSMGRKANTTIGSRSTALGADNEASGAYSFATGYNTKASGSYAHAEGQNTEATQTESHAEGNYTHATNTAAHAEGNNTNAKGYYSHAEGNNTNANYEAAHAEGSYTTAGYKAHSEGYYTVATGEGSHAEGGYSQATQEYSHAEGYQTTASGQHSHSEGSSTTASGNYSHAEGYATQATVLYAHAEGTATLAAAPEAHAEGGYTKATNEAAHAEGGYTEASGYYSHTEGYQTKASGTNAHAEGFYTIAPGRDSHASGRYNKMDLYPDWVSGTEYKVGDCVLYSYVGYKCKTANTDENFTDSKWDQLPTNSPVAMAIGNGESENARSNALTVGWNGSLAHGVNVNASGEGSYASGIGSTASGVYTHAEGYAAQATNTASHAEGIQSQSTHQGSHAEGISSFATGAGAHAEGNGGATASNSGAHAEGSGTTASGLQSHAEGMGSRATGDQAHAEGSGTNAVGGSAHSEGGGTRAEGGSSHAEGGGTQAIGSASHAEGMGSRATGMGSHAEGAGSEASGMDAHAEGCGTIASANYSHASGIYNVAMTLYPDWVANTTYKVGDRVNKGGSGYECITENSDAAWTASKWKERPSNSDTAFVIGNGNATTRSNAMELKWNGDMALQGDMTLFKGTANEFNVSSLKDAGGVEIFDFNLNRQRVITTTATVADIIAAIDSGKSALGHMTMAVSGANLDGYTPLTATKMGSIMMLVLGKFDMGEVEIWLSGQSRGGTDVWGINFVQTLKATGDDNGAFPQAYSAETLPIKNLGAPTANTDAATKKYVDDQVGGMVADVQVNSTSVLNNGVANIPIASNNNLGVVKTGALGVEVRTSDGVIYVNQATENDIKNGNNNYHPICSPRQHLATFYGLAKAAGDITQNQSSNAVGTYTPEAKAAIQNMLGISSVESQTGLSVVDGQLCITYEEVSA